MARGWVRRIKPACHLSLGGPRCKTSSHELVVTRGGRAPRLSPWQSARGAGGSRARFDCRKGRSRLHHRRGRATCRRQSSRAVSAFPRCRGAAGRGGAARFRAICRRARRGVERWQAAAGARVRGGGPRLPRLRAQPAGALRGDVRGADRFHLAPRAFGRRGSRLRRAARGGGPPDDCAATGPEDAVVDDVAAYLGDGARDRLAVRARGSIAAEAADVAGRVTGGWGAAVSAESWAGGWTDVIGVIAGTTDGAVWKGAAHCVVVVRRNA